MTTQESRQRGGVAGYQAMAAKIQQKAADRQEQWLLDVATAIEQYSATASGRRGHPDILSALERKRHGGYQAA